MSSVVTQLVLRSKVKENVEVAPTSVLPSLAKRKMKLKVREKKAFFYTQRQKYSYLYAQLFSTCPWESG